MRILIRLLIAASCLALSQVGRGRFKTARGGTNWKATTALRPGGNRITVRAIDGAGNVSRSTRLTVIRS